MAVAVTADKVGTDEPGRRHKGVVDFPLTGWRPALRPPTKRRPLSPSHLALLLIAVAAAGVCVLSCAKTSDTPTAPRLHSISGRVRLIGHVVRNDGVVIDTRVFDDADGVAVLLTHGPTLVGQALTTAGIYTFKNLPPGDYVARANVIGAVLDSTLRMTVANYDVFSQDTLLFTSAGDIVPVPNPMGASADLYFALSDTETVNVRVLDLAGNVVRPLWSGLLSAGLHFFTWDGTDLIGDPAPQAIFWATVQGPHDARAQLLFR
jgi:hypothetical protein